MKKTKWLQVRTTPEMLATIKLWAALKGWNISQFVLAAIDAFIKNEEMK